jgi:acetyl-CoA C-acetyltransferase
MYEAAVKAYEDAGGINPRDDIDSFISVSEDFWEGTSIFDEYVPDQLGGALRPVCTITGEGIHGLIMGVMQILTGEVDTVAVESHSKISEVMYPDNILAFALDPILTRPLEVNPHTIAGLEMQRYLHETGSSEADCAAVVVKNKSNALLNPIAAYPAKITVQDVLSSGYTFSPLHRLDMSQPADGSIVVVLASGAKVQEFGSKPIWIKGVGWCNETPAIETRDWSGASYAKIAAKMAYRIAGIKNPRNELDFAELDDTYSYKELQHIEALAICPKGMAAKYIADGYFDREGEFPINVSGGSLGLGHLLEANGLARIAEGVLQLRGEAGKRQVHNAKSCIIQSWRGVPTTAGAVMILSSERA